MDLARYQHRFGGEGTIVTLVDGRAFTAAHCLAAVDGRPGTIVTGLSGRAWRVEQRWSPRGCDLALLTAEPSVPKPRGHELEMPGVTLAGAGVLRPGVLFEFFGYAGGRFVARRALVTSVTPTHVVADVISRTGVRAGDSGGPVLVGDQLVGIVVARAGLPARSGGGSRTLELTRLDSPLMRRRIAAALANRTS